MLLRILLILAILAGVGVVVVSHFQLRPHIQGIIDEREKNAKDRDAEKAAKVKVQGELKATQTRLSNTEKELGNTRTQLANTKIQVENEQKRANELKQTLDKTKEDLRSAQQELSAWKLLGIPVEQVSAIIASEKKLHADIEAMEQEKKILLTEIDRQRKLIEQYTVGRPEIEFPLPTTAKVLAVDPKWEFIVLNVGTRQNVTNNCVGLVSHNGKLVAKVRVTSVEPNQSIANVMPGWSLGEIMEGDVVLPPF